MIQALNIIKLVLKIVITILSVSLIVTGFSKKNIKKFHFNTKKTLEKKLKNKRFLSYEKIEKYLKQTGAVFMFNMNPSDYILIKIGSSLLFLLVGISLENILIALILTILGFFIIDIFLYISNDDDNNKILVDLKNVYDTLRIQTKAGVYFTNSLTECYLVAKNSRLKTALLDLNNKIISENDIENSIEDFNSKFNNTYIDTFCIVIKQSLTSGRTVQVLNDLSEQIKDIQDSLAIKEEQKIERKLQVVQFLLYIGAIAIVVFAMSNELTKALTNF